MIALSGQAKRGRYCMRAEGWKCVAKQLRPPPFSHTKTQHPPPPLSASLPPWQGGPHTNKHLEMVVLVDSWLLFFSKKVNFMADLRRKCGCRSAVELVDTHSFGVPFSSFSVF